MSCWRALCMEGCQHITLVLRSRCSNRWTRQLITVVTTQLIGLVGWLEMRRWPSAMWLVVEIVITIFQWCILRPEYSDPCGFGLDSVATDYMSRWHNVWWNLQHPLQALKPAAVICRVYLSWNWKTCVWWDSNIDNATCSSQPTSSAQ